MSALASKPWMLPAGPFMGREGLTCGTSGKVRVLHFRFWPASMLWRELQQAG